MTLGNPFDKEVEAIEELYRGAQFNNDLRENENG